jgi:7,8-dihydro-6-hydroxymethylpterin dimethyltransferase
MKHSNLGLCNQCRSRVPSEFFFRESQVWIRKDCPSCGPNESLVSRDAKAWQAKRDVWRDVPTEPVACSLHCDRCRNNHKPNMVFLDVTNRCNMNCPICIASIRGMGFDFNPPLEYFEKIFSHISRMDPRPMVELFGGEPTMRDDLLDVIAIGRRYKLKPRVVTNGLKLADEEYCRKLCDSGVRVRFAFDGRNSDIYERLRRNRGAYEKKIQGLENLSKYSRRRQSIIACAAWGINDQYIGDLIQFCHQKRDLISELGIIPLTENWKPGEYEVGVHTTLEDVEKMVRQSLPGEDVEFIPAGLSYSLRKPRSFFRRNSRSEILLLGGVHPNCESMTLLISDGKKYRSINHYLKAPFHQVCTEFVELSKKMEPKLDRLDPERFFQRIRGQIVVATAVVPWLLRRFKFWRLLGGSILDYARRLFSKSNGPVRRRPARILRVAGLPFEEEHSIDAARLENCKAVFAYEDAEDGEVKTIPACLWYPYRNEFLKKISQKYAAAKENTEIKPSEKPEKILAD